MSYNQIPSEPHQLIQADDDDLEALSFSQPGVNASTPSPRPEPSSSATQNTTDTSKPILAGKIGQSEPSKPTSSRGWGGIKVETRYTGEPTLDEPVSTTVMRDLKSIYSKLTLILYPPQGGHHQLLRDWDLWGPLVICLAFAIILSVDAPQDQSMQVFSLVVSLITVGSVIITVNSKLLGGKVSFFQSLCVLGYALAPILVASIIAFFVRNIFVRIPVTLACWAWSVWASMNFFNGTQLPESRTFLAVYPMCLFFFVLSWMIIIQ
ncbi:hypothetical protein L204_101061 [Cryptococcus depauperatus]